MDYVESNSTILIMTISNLLKDKINTDVDAYLFFEIGNLSYSKSDSLGSSLIISLGLINE